MPSKDELQPVASTHGVTFRIDDDRITVSGLRNRLPKAMEGLKELVFKAPADVEAKGKVVHREAKLPGVEKINETDECDHGQGLVMMGKPQFEKAAPAPTSGGSSCLKCGWAFPVGRFCIYCGTEKSVAGKAVASQAAQQTKTNKH